MPIHRNYALFLVLALWLATGSLGYAQMEHGQGAFRTLSRAEGLPRSSVFAITQDSLGVLWFGTRGGVCRFDGHRFTLFQPQAADNLADKYISVLYVDPQNGDLWMGAAAGLLRYRQRTDEVERFRSDKDTPDGLSPGIVNCILRDEAGQLWVGTSTGLNLFDPESGRFERQPVSGQANTAVTFIGQGPGTSLYVGTRKGLYSLKAGTSGDFTPSVLLRGQEITAGRVTEDGSVWLGTEAAGLLQWKPAADTVFRYRYAAEDPGSLSNDKVEAIAGTTEGGLWVGTAKGLNYLPPAGKGFVRYYASGQQAGELHDDFIKSLLIDRTGSLWVGTYYSGVQHLDERYNIFTNYHHDPHENSISGNIVSAFAETPAGHLYVGTEGDGLNYLNTTTGQFRHFPAGPGSLSGNNVKRLLLDGSDLWIGTWQAGLNHYNTLTGKFTHYRHDAANPASLGHDNTYALHREGNLLWIPTYGGGLDIMDLTTETFAHFRHDPSNANSLSSDLARTILKGGDHLFWVGTDVGLNRITTDDRGYPATFEHFFPNEIIYSSYLAADGTLWFGTSNNGVFAYPPAGNAVKHYTTADGLAGNSVFGILPDDDGKLWFSTENGLSALSLATATFANFDHTKGLQNKEYNYHAFYRTQDGELLFGGLNGFTVFDPTDIRPAGHPPPLILTGLQRNGESVSVGDESGLLRQNINEVEELVFGYGEAVFTLQFAALDYFSPENNRYAYKLEGLDQDWRYLTGKGEVSYTIQREGDYRLLLKAASGDGSWSEKPRQLNITVLPPPHRSWWAYLGYALLLLAAVAGITYFVRLRHRIQLQEIARRQQEELTEMKLRFFTNITHEFRTPLTLILGPLQQLLGNNDRPADESRQLTLVQRNAYRLLDLVDQTLTFRKLVTGHETLRPEAVEASGLVEKVFADFRDLAQRRGISYSYHAETSGLTLWLDVDKIEKILYNLLSNAFKVTPDKGSIRLTMRKDRKVVKISVEDSGPGVEPALEEKIFERFYEKASGRASTIDNSGIGLALSRELARLHGGDLTLSEATGSEEFSALGGASFTVTLPLDREPISEALPPKRVEREPQALRQPPLPPNTDQPTPVPASEEVPARITDRPRVLIVDDNPDILQYLQSILAQTYEVNTATNGKAGLLSARKSPPAAIISDVMMPIMDGLAFCEAVKTDLEISHIPVILLTAQTADTSRIEGLKNGADDYLTKPFNPQELLLRIRNMLLARWRSQQKFVTTLTLEPQEITITNTDERFLRKSMEVVEEQMGNSVFKVDDFATAMAVSRSLLFTKIKALTGQTPNNFVKTLRLKRAAQLLQSGQMNVSEVTYAVGFRDPKYFRKCFKEQFDELPSNYRQATSDI